MSPRFEELDWCTTPMGDLSLRRRIDPVVGIDVYEVKLGEDFLMSSLFTVAEIAVARLALSELHDEALDVVVGGLGLGYTAVRVLADPRVASLLVVEAHDRVIDWHERGLLTTSAALTGDPRMTFVHGDFFALAAGSGFDPVQHHRRFHAVVLDIDHSPRHVLHPSHAAFYAAPGTRRLAEHLSPGGVFALWSNDPPDDDYRRVLEASFESVRVEIVAFDNPLQGRESANTVYVACTPSR
ncbi:MAG: polyamine aminopropyltransferase [Candidatus Nanopelagicales bacterium]